MSHFAYVTVLSRDENLPGVIVLAHSLRSNGSHLPLVVVCSTSVSPQVLDALKSKTATSLDITVEVVDPNSMTNHLFDSDEQVAEASSAQDSPSSLDASSSTLPPPPPNKTIDIHQHPSLLAFSPPLWKYETVCYLSSTTVIARHGMDLVFTEAQLPMDSCVAAIPLCTCSNLDDKSPHSINGLPCPYSLQLDPKTPLRRAMSFSASVAAASPIEPGAMAPKGAGFDDRVVVFYPGERLWDRMKEEAVLETLRNEGQGLNGNGHEPHTEQSKADENGQTWSSLLEKVFKNRWAALPWYYCVSEELRTSHWDLAVGHDSRIVAFQVERGAWKCREEQTEQEAQTRGKSEPNQLDAILAGAAPQPRLDNPIDIPRLSEPNSADGMGNGTMNKVELEQERMPLKLVTSLMENHRGRAWEEWQQRYEAWTNSLHKKGDTGLNELEQCMQSLMDTQACVKGKASTCAAVETTASGNNGGTERFSRSTAKTARDRLLSPINEASPASEGHLPFRSFEQAHLSMYRRRAAVERGPGPVIHRPKPTEAADSLPTHLPLDQ